MQWWVSLKIVISKFFISVLSFFISLSMNSRLLSNLRHESILSDIDECSVTKNGGCSQKCVNTEGGYKCECPDPELILSQDNKTCHGKY